ncbi:hypothetical protein AAFF_G00263370 [Aldrovandia affinis]|uniref:Uncharacterized protein n=1 Tax=Aldrovandia affinis TaxID=143900 RepID=A0AAD7SST0_9TELE|nr:hypothetical protein AAFF_G00263370 [Aldrovandia affinis]
MRPQSPGVRSGSLNEELRGPVSEDRPGVRLPDLLSPLHSGKHERRGSGLPPYPLLYRPSMQLSFQQNLSKPFLSDNISGKCVARQKNHTQPLASEQGHKGQGESGSS